MYVPFGAAEPFEAIGREQELPQSGGKYVFNLYEGIDWTRPSGDRAAAVTAG